LKKKYLRKNKENYKTIQKRNVLLTEKRTLFLQILSEKEEKREEKEREKR
jgi:hypothetical protein